MKRHLFKKFVFTYIFAGIGGFLLLTFVGPGLLTNYLGFTSSPQNGQTLLVLYLLFGLMYLPAGILLILYYLSVHRPLQEITKGAAEYASGNLSYKIPVDSVDEMGYLANTLNYMADKLNANGNFQRDFISNVSHDFRSPLTSIKGYVVAMLDGTIPPDSQEHYLKIIEAEADRLEKLTQSLLTLNDLEVKKRTLSRSQFDINHTIRTTCALFEGSCKARGIHLRLILCGQELYANADEEQIQQVLYNLLDNAIKFSPDHSMIILETSYKANKIFVSVEDHGCGIPKESLPKIWTRFYKTDSSRGKDRNGTGLGLCIVKEILRAHDQQIDVVSTEGIGSKFIFTLEKAQ